MSANRFLIVLTSLLALVLAGVFLFGPKALAADEKDTGTYTGIPKDKSCTWWLDESKEVSKEDKAAIGKLFTALQTKLKRDGLDSVEFPWKAPTEEEAKAEDEKTKAEAKANKEIELTDEQKKWEKDELFEDPEVCPGVIIPSPDDLNIVKVDGATTGTLFIVRGTIDDPRIEVWRVKINKKGDEWLVTGREIDYSFEPVYLYNVKKNTMFKFKEIRIDHDLMHVSAKNGRFYPMYSGNDKIVGGTVFTDEGVMNYKPPTKLAKDWETDQEVYQMRIKTERFLGKGKGIEEIKDAKLTKFTFFFTPANFDKFVKIDGLERAELTDHGEFREAKKLAEDEIKGLADTKWGANLTYKGQPKAEKKTLLPLYYLPDYDELGDIYAYTSKYYWVGYQDIQQPPCQGIQEEIQVYENRETPLTIGAERRSGEGVLCLYNRADQRESFTRREAEYESLDAANLLDRKIDANIGFKEETMNAENNAGIFMGNTGIFAKFRCTTKMEITKPGETVLFFEFGFLPTSNGPSDKVIKVVDERGLDILRISDFTLVYPPLASGQRLSFTSEYEGATFEREFATSAYTSALAAWFPGYGYLDCAPFEAVVGVPKPNIGVTSGALVGEWEDGSTSFTHWVTDECIRMATICYSDFTRDDLTFDRPDGGGTMKFYYFHHNKEFITVSDADIGGFYDRESGGDPWTGQGRTSEENWRGVAAFHKVDFTMLDPKSVEDEFRSITKYQQALYLAYPYKEFSAVMMPFLSNYGQSLPGLLKLDGTSFTSDGDRAEYDFLFFNFFGAADWRADMWSHESGHQFWGHVLGWKANRDQWFSESFTEYQSGTYMQASRGEEPFREKLQEWHDWAMHAYEYGPVAMSQDRTGQGGGWMGMYHKGPYVLHMLRQDIGDKAFIAFQRNLLKSMYFKTATTGDIREVLEQTLGKENMKSRYGKEDMGWWFDQWLCGMGIPSYEYGYELSGNTAKVKIKHVKAEHWQEQPGETFRVRIPIWVHSESGDEYAIPVLLTGEKPIEEFDLALRGPAEKLVLDEFGAVLTRDIKEVKYNDVE